MPFRWTLADRRDTDWLNIIVQVHMLVTRLNKAPRTLGDKVLTVLCSTV